MTESTKRRVLIYSTAYYPFVAGAEVAVKEITDRLVDGFEFDLITAKLDKKLKNFERIGNVNVYRLGTGNKYFDKILLPLRGAFFTLKLKRKNNYHCFWAVMVSFSSGAAYISNILSLMVGSKKVPILLNLQEGDSETHLKYKWAGLIALSWKLALKQASYVTALSNFLLDRARKNGYNGASALVPNGVDVDVFTKVISVDDVAKYKKMLGKKPDEVFLITTSRLNNKNATDNIIDSLPFLSENVSLLVAGVGEELPKLENQVNNLGLKNRVKFLGFVNHKDLPKYFSVCDIFIRPSRSEGFGNSFIEAMAFGLPVIATPVGGIVDFISDKETGIFCSVDNPKSIAEKVEFLLNNTVEKNEITKKAKELVVSKYNWSNIAKKMHEVFNQIK